MLCIPFFADQGYNSSIVKHLQFGRRLWRRQASSEAMPAAVEEILTNGKYLKASLKISDELRRKEGGKALAWYAADIIHSSRMDESVDDVADLSHK
jgi:UDP:flavonoid glycosyltransferase YjiC (YdhE family)